MPYYFATSRRAQPPAIVTLDPFPTTLKRNDSYHHPGPELPEEIDLAGPEPLFRKFRDGPVDSNNICILFPSTLSSHISAQSVPAYAEAAPYVGDLDPELVLPSTPPHTSPISTPGNTPGSTITDISDLSISLDPLAEARARLARPKPTMSRKLEYVPPPRFIEIHEATVLSGPKALTRKFARSLRRQSADVPVTDWPVWGEMMERADLRNDLKKEQKAKAEQKEKTRNMDQSDRHESTPPVEKKSKVKPSKKRKRIPTPTPSPSPQPEKRDPLHFRDSESLTPLPESFL